MRIQTSGARNSAGWLLALVALGCSGVPAGNTCSTNSAAGASSTDACTGGAAATGGAANGGDSSAGGGVTTGGAPASGGAAPGGASATGGDVSTGGTSAAGGAAATGGDVSTGGTPDTGGAAATGGDVSTGGTPASGGAEATGGTPATGGAEATGGTPATGGAEATGGTPPTGGAAATGGASSISPDDAFAAAPKFPAVGATEVPVDAWLSLTFDSPPTIGATGRIRIRKVLDDSQVDVINVADSPSTVKIGSTYSYTPPAPATAIPFRSCTLGANVATTDCDLTAFGFNTTVNYLGYDKNAYVRALGVTPTWRVRIVKYNPVRVSGNQLRIYPHDGVLEYDTQYYVTIDNGAVAGTLGGTAFAGVTSKTAWTFTTKPAAPTGTAWAVDADGVSGDFMTVQGAINAVPWANTTPITVTVADGVYEELLSNYNKGYLTINGQSRAGTIIQYENYDTFLPGTGNWVNQSTGSTSYTTPNGDVLSVPITGATATFNEGGRALYLLAATGNEINNLTVRNTHVKSTSIANNAAECLYFSSTAGTSNPAGKFISRNSNWISSQSTLQLKAYTWFYNSLIAGDVDIIWGVPLVNLFENCEIRTRVDPTAATGPAAVQSRGAAPNPGFIFLNSTFTAEAGVQANSAYLGRSVSSTTGGTLYYDAVVFTGCTIGAHIRVAGYSGTSASTAPTAATGVRQFGLVDTANSAWVPSGGTTPFYALTDTENTGLYGSRTVIFGGATVVSGTNTYNSTAWTLTP